MLKGGPKPRTNVDHRTPRTSELLAAVLAAQEGEKVAIGDLVNALRNRAFGILFLIFGIPNCIPMPPGIPVICGIVLGLIGLQMLMGRQELWLPGWISRRTFSRSVLDTIVNRSQPYIQKFERLSRPRLEQFAGPLARRLVGATVVLLGFILLLPIPFLGNLPPGFAVCIFGLGLVERDGGVILAGFFATVIGLLITAAMSWAIWQGAIAIF
ncbi:MAG: exopolysaccharide biosynthesis protein exod [Azorhizobium sp. 35-67-5]|nr:MAG: exopolysaccharide biosynthesis protein exod [Rhizobiales bacterium 12-68-15]OYX86862.1 MAG: exopolysaccharide biosynthesis protein exod [Azorhizobium sp. 32-67-21]OYX87818.1 MAG: exopolysaccharide biosynthesis protein exod [Azorhizobium sp. 35-67-5]